MVQKYIAETQTEIPLFLQYISIYIFIVLNIDITRGNASVGLVPSN